MASSHVPFGEVELVLDAHASTGESPTWLERAGVLYWIDIEEPAIHCFDPRTGNDRYWEMPSEIGSFAFCKSEHLIVALRTGLVKVGLSTGSYELLAAPPYNPRTHRFNGGKCDASGRLWVGTMIKPLRSTECDGAEPGERAKPIHMFEEPNRLRSVEARAAIANGFAWSPDNRTMYLTDSESRTIHIFDFDVGSGDLSHRRILRQFSPAEGRPDGAAVDAEGNYWCALYGGGRVICLGPDGEINRAIALPVSQPTMCAFGGPDLDIMYITSASNGLDADARRREPQAGGLFQCRPGVRGQTPNLFSDEAEE